MGHTDSFAPSFTHLQYGITQSSCGERATHESLAVGKVSNSFADLILVRLATSHLT